MRAGRRLIKQLENACIRLEDLRTASSRSVSTYRPSLWHQSIRNRIIICMAYGTDLDDRAGSNGNSAQRRLPGDGTRFVANKSSRTFNQNASGALTDYYCVSALLGEVFLWLKLEFAVAYHIPVPNVKALYHRITASSDERWSMRGFRPTASAREGRGWTRQ